jgi:transposase
MNYEEISIKYNIPVTTLYSRVFHLKIKGAFKGRKINFSKKQVEQLLEYKPLEYLDKYRMNNDRRKLKIIEFYLKLRSGRRVTIMLNISRRFVDAAIREYNNTGFVIVESKMNKTEFEIENVNLI